VFKRTKNIPTLWVPFLIFPLNWLYWNFFQTKWTSFSRRDNDLSKQMKSKKDLKIERRRRRREDLKKKRKNKKDLEKKRFKEKIGRMRQNLFFQSLAFKNPPDFVSIIDASKWLVFLSFSFSCTFFLTQNHSLRENFFSVFKAALYLYTIICTLFLGKANETSKNKISRL